MQVVKGYNEVVKQVEALGSRSGKTSKLVYIGFLNSKTTLKKKSKKKGVKKLAWSYIYIRKHFRQIFCSFLTLVIGRPDHKMGGGRVNHYVSLTEEKIVIQRKFANLFFLRWLSGRVDAWRTAAQSSKVDWTVNRIDCSISSCFDDLVGIKITRRDVNNQTFKGPK